MSVFIRRSYSQWSFIQFEANPHLATETMTIMIMWAKHSVFGFLACVYRARAHTVGVCFVWLVSSCRCQSTYFTCYTFAFICFKTKQQGILSEHTNLEYFVKCVRWISVNGVSGAMLFKDKVVEKNSDAIVTELLLLPPANSFYA